MIIVAILLAAILLAALAFLAGWFCQAERERRRLRRLWSAVFVAEAEKLRDEITTKIRAAGAPPAPQPQ